MRTLSILKSTNIAHQSLNKLWYMEASNDSPPSTFMFLVLLTFFSCCYFESFSKIFRLCFPYCFVFRHFLNFNWVTSVVSGCSGHFVYLQSGCIYLIHNYSSYPSICVPNILHYCIFTNAIWYDSLKEFSLFYNFGS
jgi:hypothetical protein